MFIRWILLGVALVGAVACQRKATESPYFPVDAGRTWSYTLTRDGQEEGAAPLVLRVESTGAEEVGGQRVGRQKIDLDGETHFLFVGVDERGVYRHATQSPGEDAPSVDGARDYFLVNPLEVGKSWAGQGAPTFLDVVDVPVPIVSRVVSTSETVRTPAGEFTDCIKIEVTGSAEIRGDDDGDDEAAGDEVAAREDAPGEAKTGAATDAGREGGDDADAEDEQEDFDLVRGTFKLHEQTWYAKGVGVVKSVIVETFTSDFDEQRIEVTTELQAFTR